MTKTPDEVLTEVIIAAFREKKLASEINLNAIAVGLSGGSLTAEDWRLFANTEINKSGEVGDGKAN
ncbi:MAG: hypothetical protein RDU59_11825 [Thermodesulfobacteriota bacterium]|nr:hypothetical protein [Thermodesulfobacteriota bacterium]